MKQLPIVVETPAVVRVGKAYRAQAMIDGEPLWFETHDVPLLDAPEAFVASLVSTAHQLRRELKSSAAVCPVFARNLDHVDNLFHEWWNYPPLKKSLPIGATLPKRSGKTALLFSGGVDAFHTLVRYPGKIDALVLVVNYELPPRVGYLTAMFREVAERRGMDAIVVRSSLQYHPAYRGTRWWQAHGAAYAAVGHLLADQFGTLLISSSYPERNAAPNGSHYRLDPLWSSSCLEIVHWGQARTRREKLLDISQDPMALAHVLPCISKKSSANCSRCEKCMRTQVALVTCGMLERFTAFCQSTPLSKRMDEVNPIFNPILFAEYEEALTRGLPGDLDAAVRRFLARSRRTLLKRRMTNFVGKFFGRRPTIEREYGNGAPYAQSA